MGAEQNRMIYGLEPIFTGPMHLERLRWSRGSVLAFGTQVRGFKPAEAVGFLRRKISQHAFIRRGSKAVGPM